MATINIKQLGELRFEVTVPGNPATTHVVTVAAHDAARLTGGQISVEQLIRRSFDFLLERESNSSIMRSFDLSVITRYFPEYERVMMAMLTDAI